MAINLEGLKALSQTKATIEVPIPGSDEMARLRKITVAEYRKIMGKAGGKEINSVDFAADLLAVSWVDDDCNDIFATKEARAVLDALPAEVLQPLMAETVKFSALDADVAEEAGKD